MHWSVSYTKRSRGHYLRMVCPNLFEKHRQRISKNVLSDLCTQTNIQQNTHSITYYAQLTISFVTNGYNTVRKSAYYLRLGYQSLSSGLHWIPACDAGDGQVREVREVSNRLNLHHCHQYCYVLHFTHVLFVLFSAHGDNFNKSHVVLLRTF